MKIKCKICKVKGEWGSVVKDPSEFWASRFLNLHSWDFSLEGNPIFICRECVQKVLRALQMESYDIGKLYEPKIKEQAPEKKK